VALGLLTLGCLTYGSHVILERVEARLSSAGLQGHVAIELGLYPRLTIDGLQTTEPVTKRGVSLSLEAQEFAISVDVIGGLLDGAWLAEPVKLHGARAEVSWTAKAASAERSQAAPVQAALESKLTRALSDWCTHDCALEVTDAALSWEGAGVTWPGWSGVDGQLRVTQRGAGTLRLEDAEKRSMTLSAAVANWPEAHTLVITGRHEGELDLSKLGLAEHVPELQGLSPVRGSVTGLSLIDGTWVVSGLEIATEDTSGRSLAAHIERVIAPQMQSLNAMLEGLSLEGLSVRAELAERGAHLASARRITFEGQGLFPCTGERWCPSSIEGARATLAGQKGLWSALAVETGSVSSCGPECLTLKDSALEVRRGTEVLDAAWRHIQAGWEEGAKGPAVVHLDGGHARAELVFEGLAKNHEGALVPVAPEVFDAAGALSAFSLRPNKRRRGKPPLKAEETGRLIRTLVQTADKVVDSGLERWPEVRARWAELTRSDDTQISLTDARYEVTLGELPTLDGRIERLEGRMAQGGLTLSVDGRLAVPEALHLPDSAQTMSMPASHRGFWGGPGHFEGRVDVSYRAEEGLKLSFDGRTPWLHMAHERIALERIDVAPLDLRGTLSRHQDDATLRWELEGVDILAARGGHLHFSAGVSLESARKRGRLQFAAELPMQDCGALHQSIPAAMLYGLQGAKFRGEAGLSVAVDYPLHAVAGLRVSLGADFEGCVADTLGEDIDIAALNKSGSVFHVYDHRLNKAIRVGPGTGNWVSLSSMPAHVWGAAMATEDFNFFSHQGFSRTFIGRALRLNLRTRRYAYGGSTITQQLVKNLFLTRHKTLARKLVEAVLVWQVERHVSKRRILSLYVNCIEYGPRIYGIRNAARRYFGTVPSRLSPVESAFIMNIKPFPWTGYWTFKRRMLTSFFTKRAQVIKERLLGRGYISAEQAENMLATNLYTRFLDTL